MLDRDRPKFDATIRTFAATFRAPAVIEDNRLYWMALQEYTLDEFSMAMRSMADVCKFMPAPSEIRDMCEVARHTMLEAKRRADGEEEHHWRTTSHRCRRCQDIGWVMVWSPDSQFDARRIVLGEVEEDFRPRRNTCSIHCDCKKGDRIRAAHDRGRERKGWQYRYQEVGQFSDDAPWVICESGGDEQDVHRLMSWAENFVPKRRPPEFDA